MKITKIITAIIMAFAVTSAMAEEAKLAETSPDRHIPPKTLFDIKTANWSAYGGVYTAYSKIGEADSCLVGGRGGVIINDHFVLGMGGAGMSYPTDREKVSGSNYSGDLNKIGFGYGGVLTEYYLNPKDLVVFSAGTLIGAGGVGFTGSDENMSQSDQNKDHGDSFFVVEPEINTFINITQFCRLGVGVSYRYTAGINSHELSDKDFSGPSAKIMAQFGWF